MIQIKVVMDKERTTITKGKERKEKERKRKKEKRITTFETERRDCTKGEKESTGICSV